MSLNALYKKYGALMTFFFVADISVNHDEELVIKKTTF